MEIVSARGVNGIAAVVPVSPHRVADAPMFGLNLAVAGDGGVLAQLALRARQLPLAWYARQNPATDLEEY